MSPLRMLRAPRAATATELIEEVFLDDLLGAEAPSSRPCWADCPSCGQATAGVAHTEGWTCGECLVTSALGLPTRSE